MTLFYLDASAWVKLMIASDAELLAAASLEGFAILDPRTDPPLPVVP